MVVFLGVSPFRATPEKLFAVTTTAIGKRKEYGTIAESGKYSEGVEGDGGAGTARVP